MTKYSSVHLNFKSLSSFSQNNIISMAIISNNKGICNKYL